MALLSLSPSLLAPCSLQRCSSPYLCQNKQSIAMLVTTQAAGLTGNIAAHVHAYCCLYCRGQQVCWAMTHTCSHSCSTFFSSTSQHTSGSVSTAWRGVQVQKLFKGSKIVGAKFPIVLAQLGSYRQEISSFQTSLAEDETLPATLRRMTLTVRASCERHD